MTKIFVAITLIFSIASSFAITKHSVKRIKRGGGMDGGGSGVAPAHQGSAWFYQDKSPNVISTCVVKGATFAGSEEDIRSGINAAFVKWEKYIIEKHIHRGWTDGTTGQHHPVKTKMKILSKNKIIHFSSKDDCPKNTELTFYLGVQNKRVKKAMSLRPNDIAIAYREKTNLETGISTGIVWIFDPIKTPDFQDNVDYDWANKHNLEAILTHEIGHVMGNEHKDNTIMRKDLSHILISLGQTTPSSDETTRLMSIDHYEQIALEFKENEAIEGIITLGNKKEAKETFKRFTGKEAVGETKAEFVLLPSTTDSKVNLKLVLIDSKSRNDFPLIINAMGMDADMGFSSTEMFKTVRSTEETDEYGTWTEMEDEYYTDSYGVYYSQIKTKSSTAETLLVNITVGMTGITPTDNVDRTTGSDEEGATNFPTPSAIAVYFFENAKRKRLFVKPGLGIFVSSSSSTTSTDSPSDTGAGTDIIIHPLSKK